MARVFIEGFEGGTADAWDYYSGSGLTVSGSYKYSGNYGAYGNGTTLRKDLPSSKTTLYAAFKVKLVSNANRSIFNFRYNATTYAFHIYQRNPPLLAVMVGHNTATYTHPSFLLNAGTWYFVELYFLQHASAGAFEVKVDGVSRLSQTGINTGPYAVNHVEIGPMYYSSYPNHGYYDDIVIDDADWIGDTRIYGISPNGAGNSSTWTPSAGSNYECVDEVPASDADYVETSIADNVDTYALASMPSVYEVKSVQVQTRAQKTGAPDPANLALVVRPPTGGTDYAGSDQAAETSWRGHIQLWENNPYTSSPWTESEVNGMEAGIKSRA